MKYVMLLLIIVYISLESTQFGHFLSIRIPYLICHCGDFIINVRIIINTSKYFEVGLLW